MTGRHAIVENEIRAVTPIARTLTRMNLTENSEWADCQNAASQTPRKTS
jgi:hypothetical protein